MGKDSTADLSGEGLGRLLRLGVEPVDVPGDAESDPMPEEALEALLSRRLSLSEEAEPGTKRTLRELLADPTTSVGAFEALKDYGKTLAAGSGSKVGEAVATALYYAAICGALVCHGRKVTQHSYARLDENLAKLTDRAWMPQALRVLFREAQEICRQRMAESPKKQND